MKRTFMVSYFNGYGRLVKKEMVAFVDTGGSVAVGGRLTIPKNASSLVLEILPDTAIEHKLFVVPSEEPDARAV